MLNMEQEKAANFKDGQMLVVSCPGSGKTTVIVERANRLVNQGIDPQNILVISFTKEAAMQMQQRYEQKFGKSQMCFGTIHALCFKVISRAYGFYKENILMGTDQWEFFLKFLYKKVETTDITEYIKNLIMEIGYVRNKGMEYSRYVPQHSDQSIFRAAFCAYREYKQDVNKIDFEDMLVLCRKCFLNRPEELAFWQGQFRYIMIDEYQDTNTIQADIFYMLAGDNGNIFVVGDDDQSIYRFRSADSSIMLNFPKHFKECQVVYMDTNYRSTGEIIESASKLISNNKKRFEKAFKVHRSNAGAVTVKACDCQTIQTREILKDINTARNEGMDLNNMAVLYRTNMENQILIGKLMKYEIPFYTTDTPKDYHDDFIFQDIMAYYRLTAECERMGDLQRILNKPSRYLKSEVFKHCSYDKAEMLQACKRLGDRSAQAMAKIYELINDVTSLKGKAPFAFVTEMITNMGYLAYIDSYCAYVSRDRESTRQLLNMLIDESKEFKSMEEWQAYAKFYHENLMKKKREKKKDGICLSTFHSAKGLEWNRVYIMNANEGVCPFKKAETKEDYEEERRLFYVAVTRAKDICKIYYTLSDGNKKRDASRFLYEMGKTE